MATMNNGQESRRKMHIPEETREHARRAREEMRESIRTLLPEGFIEHRRSARREMLLAWRSLIDAALKRMEEKE
jgi:hypothetical protein